jgi:HEAT repeat protein
MRRFVIAACVVGALSVATLVAVVWATWEPMCNGTPVRQLAEATAYAGGHNETHVWAVEQLQTVAPVAVTYIINGLNGPTNSLRDRINLQWAKLHRKLPASIQKITPKPRLRLHVDRRMWLQALAKIGGKDERVIPALTKELKHSDSEMRFFATISLAYIATNWLEHPIIGPQIIETLTSSLQDRAGNVRGAAAVGLGYCGAAAKAQVPQLVDRLSDTDGNTRMHALRALVSIGAETNLILPYIQKLTADPDSEVRAYAAYIHWKLTGEQGTNLLVLREVLHGDAEDRNRGLAAGYLGLLGPKALAAVPDLTSALADPEFQVSGPAAKALWRITGETERPVRFFKRTLAEGQSHERSYSADALTLIGTPAEAALPEIIDALAAKEYYVRKAAIRAAAAIGPNARAALPKLKNLLNDRFPSIQAEARSAIEAIELDGARVK